jgi:LacI family transcriptional regulator
MYNTAFDNKYETILTVSQENAERERKHIQTLVSMRVDGIIVSVSQQTTDVEIFKWVRKMGIPVLFVDRMPELPVPGSSTVLVDDRGGAIKAVEQAISVGYSKIAMVGGNPQINIGKNRQLGFEEALNQHGLPVKQEWIVHGGFGKEDGYRGMMHLHQLGALPEFIFAATYPVALGVIEATKVLGLHVPNDIDIICFGESDMIDFIQPSLSCVVQNTQELGARAVRTMLEIIEHSEESPERHIVIPTQLVLRETGIGKCARAEKSPQLLHTV